MRTFYWVIAALVGITQLASVSRAAAPSTLPVIPALVFDSPNSPSFVADGAVRKSAHAGLAFHCATDGKRQLCVVFDATDRTPIYLSDGHQTLVYDILRDQIILISDSRARVIVDWKASKAKPLNFQIGLDYGPRKSAPVAFRIDRFVKASAASLLPLASDAYTRSFGAERKGGKIESIEVPNGGGDWFHFSSVEAGEHFYRLLLDVRRIGKRIPYRDLAFPDIAKLRQVIAIGAFQASPKDFVKIAMESNMAVMVKMMLASDDPLTKKIDEALHHPDWNQLRKRDRRLGQAYRAALAKQGISFAAPAPATQPGH